MILKITFVIFLFSLASCGQDPNVLRSTDQGAQSMNGQQIERGLSCSCAYHHDPVCGVNGLTYTNSCVANCEGINYQNGACQDGNKACNPSSGYVCAQPPCSSGSDCSSGMPHARAYSNECSMMESNAAFIHSGLCR